MDFDRKVMGPVRIIPPNDLILTPTQPKVAVYCRISTNGLEQRTCLFLQEQYYEEWIKRILHWTFAGIFPASEAGHRRKADIYFGLEEIHFLYESSEFLLTVICARAQQEGRSKSGDIKWGLRKALGTPESRYYQRICYGYTHDKDG